MIWDQAAINALKTFHAKRVDYVEIGRRLGCSKGAIAGKCSRLELDQRPSPTAKGGRTALVAMRDDPNEERNRSILLMTALNAHQCAKQLGISINAVRYVRKKQRRRIERIAAACDAQFPRVAVVAPPQYRAPTPAPPAAAPAIYQRQATSCCWPTGERTSVYHTHRFCGCAEVVPGKPYCAEHTKLAYVRVRYDGVTP